MIPRIETNPITFGYTTTLSKLFKEGRLPSVVKGFYGGELSIDPKSLQRISNEPLSSFFNKQKADEYWEQFKDLIVEYQKGNKTKIFYGNQYIEQSKATVKNILAQEQSLDLWG